MCLFAFPGCLVNKCCYCLPLRMGCVYIAVTLVVLRLVIITGLFMAPGYRQFNPSDFVIDSLLLVTLTALSCTNAFILIIGSLKNHHKLIYLYIVLEIMYFPVNGVFRVYYVAYDINHALCEDQRQSARYLWLTAIASGIEAYFIWMVCSHYITMLKKQCSLVSSSQESI